MWCARECHVVASFIILFLLVIIVVVISFFILFNGGYIQFNISKYLGVHDVFKLLKIFSKKIFLKFKIKKSYQIM